MQGCVVSGSALGSTSGAYTLSYPIVNELGGANEGFALCVLCVLLAPGPPASTLFSHSASLGNAIMTPVVLPTCDSVFVRVFTWCARCTEGVCTCVRMLLFVCACACVCPCVCAYMSVSDTSLSPPVAGCPSVAQVWTVPASSWCSAHTPSHCSQARTSGVPETPHPVQLRCGRQGHEWDLPA